MNSDATAVLLERCFTDFVRRAPDSEVTQTSELFQVTTRTLPNIYFNAVYRSRFSASEATKGVDEIAGHYARLGLPFRWYLAPASDFMIAAIEASSHPKRILLSHALSLGIDDRVNQRDSRIAVEPLSMANIEEFVATETAAWENKGQEREKLTREHAKEALADSESASFFIARIDGQAVGACRTRLLTGRAAAYLAGGSVLAEYRRRGVYREMIYARLELLRAMGVRTALVHAARNSSSVICQRLGFQVHGNSAVVEFSAP